MKKFNKTSFTLLIMVITATMLLTLTSYALPTPYINESIEDATGTNDASKMFSGTQLWMGNELDLAQMAKDGKVGIAEKSSSATKNYIIDGNKSIFANNYISNNQTGSPYKEWCNIWMTHDTNFGLKNSSTYVVSFLMRTYTEWEVESKGALQNFAIVSIRNFRYKSGGSSLVDYYIQPNIQSPDVTPDQMIRVADSSVPANPKNTMSIKKLNDNTFSIVCKFVTSVPTADVEVGNNKWFVTYTFHGPGIVSCDNIKVYQSDLALSTFHQALPVGSTPPSSSKVTSKPTTNSTAGSSVASIVSSVVSSSDVTSSDAASSDISSSSQEDSSASDINSSSDKSSSVPTDKNSNSGLIIGIIIAAIVVVAGAGFAAYYFIFKKKAIK
jgi:hypothetical protein